MSCAIKNLAVVIGIGILALSGARTVEAMSPVDRVRSALDDMHRWVGTGENGDGWRRFLRSDQLAEQLNKGPQADRGVVVAIVGQYRGTAPGLTSQQFAAVAVALEKWLDELAPPSLDELSKAARAAKDQYVPVTDDAVQQARAELASGILLLDQALAHVDAANRSDWKQYLQWDQLLLELSNGSTDLASLRAVNSRYTSDEAGMDWEPVARVRGALRNYLNLLATRADEKAQATYATTIDEMAQRLESYAKNPSSDDAVALGGALGWLAQSRQSPRLVRDVRRHYQQPNLLVHVSRRLVGGGINDDVDDVTKVQENILGTHLEGTARTVGRVSLELLPNDERAALNLKLNGTTHSTNVGWQGPVTIYTRGVTQVSGSKRLFIDSHGFHHGDPASACCQTNSTIDDICARCGLIERLAWKKAGKSKGQAEAVGSQRAEVRVASRIDDQARDALIKPNDSFSEKFRRPLLRRDEFPRELKFSSTPEQLKVRVLQANDSQLAAPNAPPEVPGEQDLIVCAHESMVGNFSEAALGGTTLTDEKLEKLVKDATGDVPDELKIGPDKDPWSITFPREQPLSAQFANQEFKIAIRGQRFRRGDQEIKNAMRIAATYSMEKTPTGSKFTRKGDLEVDYVGHKGTLSVQLVTFKTFIRRKFESLLKPEIVSEGVKLPGRWEKAGRLRVREMNADQGWLAAAWQLEPDAPSTAAVATQAVPAVPVALPSAATESGGE